MRIEPGRAAVLFDLDGTLIDSIELILKSAQFAFQGHDGPAPTDAEWLAGVGTPLVSMFQKYARDDVQVQALISRYREFQIPNHDRLVHPYPGVVETVRSIRDSRVPMGVVTSKTEVLAQRGLECARIADCFDVIIGCDTVEKHKPDPEPVLEALKRLGAVAGSSLFVGDSIYDMAAGNAAGVITVAALWGPFSRAELEPSRPSHYLNSITELPGLLSAT